MASEGGAVPASKRGKRGKASSEEEHVPVLASSRSKKKGKATEKEKDWFHSLFGFNEGSLAQTREAVTFNAETGLLTMKTGEKAGHTFSTGLFTTPTLADLRCKSQTILGNPHRRRQANQVTIKMGDVRPLFVDVQNRHATFLAASQFNCLEMLHPGVTPEKGITGYQNDRSQGPACAMSCAAAALVRNTLMPLEYGQLGQTRDMQVDNAQGFLRELYPTGMPCRNGYLVFKKTDRPVLVAMDERLKGMTEEVRELLKGKLQVGVHSNTQVTAAEDNRQRVTQVYASAMPLTGEYVKMEGFVESGKLLAMTILEASFEAAICVAVGNRHCWHDKPGSRRVVLTLLGAGVFGNNPRDVLDVIKKTLALPSFHEAGLEVVINCFSAEDAELAREILCLVE
jgi:hypothetical protein